MHGVLYDGLLLSCKLSLEKRAKENEMMGLAVVVMRGTTGFCGDLWGIT